jgi:putative transposase
MARPLRLNRAGGFYHVTSRGNQRQTIFVSDDDYVRFLGYLPDLTVRYRLRIHGYVLMPNHYHVLLETLEPNLSRALQWLNTSYTQWFNRRYHRSGHVLEGRFRGILVDWPSWGLAVSRYVHLNPVRVAAYGLGKRMRQRARRGVASQVEKSQVGARLALLSEYRWSSYLAYRGTVEQPEWLTTSGVLRCLDRSKGRARDLYRQYVEQGAMEDAGIKLWQHLKGQVVLGEEEFIRQIQGQFSGDAEEQGSLRQLTSRPSWEAVVAVVEALKGEKWESFRDRYGDRGRDVALWLARNHGGFRLRELGERVGGLTYHSVSRALRDLESLARLDASIAAFLKKTEKLLLHNIQI